MVADSLQPWLLRPPDVQLALQQGGTQLRLQLRELQLDVGKLNPVSMGSSPLLLHAAQVQELELKLALIGTPAVLTGILRGMHVVLCPRPAEDTWWEKSRASTAGEAEEAAAADDIPSSSTHDHSQGDGGNPPPVENLHEGRSSSTNSFLVQCLVSLVLSAIRLELRDCSVTVLLHPYSNCSRSYSCSLALNSLVLEEGCIENNNTAGGGSGSSSTSSRTGLFGATLTAVHSSWKQMGTCTTKQCIVQQLTVQLKTLNSSDLSTVGGAATSSGESKSFGTAHKQQQKQQGEEGLQGFGKDSSNLPLGKLDSLVHNRDQILLLEDVTIAFRMQDLEFQGVEGDILEAVIELDARDIDVLSVLVAQLQGTSIHLTNKAGAMASRSLNDDSIAAEDDHMAKQQSEKDREQNKDSLTIAAASQNQGLALNTNGTKSSTLSTSSSSNEQAMTQVSPSSACVSAQGLFGVLAWRIWMQSFVHVITFARQRFLQVGLKSFEGVPRSMVKPWTWVLGLAQVPHIMKNTTTAEEIHSSSSTGTLASTSEAATEEEETTSADKIEDDVLSRVAVASRWVPTYALHISSGSLTLASAATAAVSDDDGVPYDSTFSAGVNRKAAVQPAVHLTLDRLSLAYGSNERATGSSVVCGSLQLHLLSILQAQPTQELEQSFKHDIIYQGRWPTIAAHTVQLLQSHPCSERKYSHHSYSLLDMVAAEISHATIAVEKHHRWQEHQSSAWSSRIWKCSAHVLGGGGLVQVGTAAAAATATGSSTTLLNKMMAPLQTGSASPFFIAEYQQIADVVERGGHLCGLTSCAMSMGQLECFVDSGISYQLSPLLVQLLNVGVPSPPHPESRGATAAPSSFVQPETSSSLNVIWTKTIKHCRSLLATAIPESFLELSVVVDSPKLRLTAAATPPTDPGDGNFKASRHSSSTGSATLVVDLGSLQIMVWPALRATPLSQLEPPKDPSKSVDESVRWWKDTLDSSSSSSSSSTVWLKRPPLPHLPQQFPWAEHEQVGSNLCIVVEDLATMLQVEGCNQTEVPLVGPISCRMESSFCRDVLCGPLGPIKSLSLAIDVKVAGVTIHMYLEELAALSEILNCYRIAFTDGFLSRPKSMGGEGSISAFTDEDHSAPSEVCESSDSANSEIVHRTGGGESSLHASTENMLLGLFALSVNAQLEAFQVAFGGHRQLEEKDSSSSSSSREASKIAALVLSKDSSSTSKPEVGNGRNRDNTTREIATSGWNIQLPGPCKGPGAYLVTKVFSLDLLLGDGHDSHLFAELDGATVGVVNDGVLSPEPPKRELRSSHQLSSLDHSSNMASDSIQEFKLLMQLPGTTNCAIDRCVVKLCGPKLVGEGISAGAADEEVASRNQVQEDTNQLGSKKPNETRTAVVAPKSHLLSHVSSSSAVDMSQLLADESGTPLLGRSKSLSNLAVKEHDNNESNPHTKPANVNKLSENNNTVFWVSATAEVGRVMVMAGRMEAIVAKVVLVASGGSTLRMNLGITKDSQSITFVTEGGMLFVQTLALSTLVEYFGIYTKLFAETATAVPNLPSKEQSRNTLEHQFKPNSDGGDQDQSTPLSRTTQRSLSLPPWAPTRRSKQMRRLSSAPRRLQGEAKQDGPPQAAAAGFEGLVSTRISGFSLVLVQAGASAAGPGEGFLLELDGNANLQVGGKVPKVAIALTRFSILGLQARAVGDTRGNNTKSARIPQFGRILSAKEGGDTSAAGVDELAGQLLAENTAIFGDDKTIPEAVAGLESSITNTKGKADGSGGPWRQIMQDLNSYILERLSISCTIERAPIIENHRTWKWRNAWHGQCSVSGLDFAITTSEVQLLLAIVAPLSGLSSSSSEAAVTDNTKRTQATEEESSEATSSPYHIPDGAVIAIKDLSEHSYLAVEENTPKSGQFHLVGVLHYTLAGDKALFKVKHQKNSSTSKTVWFSLLSLHARNSEGEPFRVHYRPGSGLADIATINDKSWELWQCVPSESVVADEGTEELDIRRSRSVFHLVNQKSKSGLALLDGAPVLVKQPGHPFKVKILAQPYKAKENISSSSSSPDGSVVVGGGEELQHAQDVEGEAIVAATVPLVKCDIQNVALTLLYETAGGLHLLPLLRLHMYDMGAVLQVGSFKTRAMSGCNISLDYFEAQSNCWVPVINPIGTDFVYRTRTAKNSFSAGLSKKTPTSIFSQLKKVDVVISEPALDTCLFLIGALEFAGPYTLRQSPVLANRCLVDNHTGVELLCCFDHGNAKQDGSIGSWESGAFLIRHTKSRRDLTSAVVASSVKISLQKGGTTSSAVEVSLADPGVRATRTRLELGEGQKSSAPGPLVVVDVTRQSQGGLSLTVSSMVRIVNASGLSLELQCRRPNQEGEGAVVLLEDGDIIDDSMGSFDALHLQGELRKALTSFNVGNFLLSIRPASVSSSTGNAVEEDTRTDAALYYEWSDDVKGAKAVRVSGLFENLHYNFRKLSGRQMEFSFATVFCPLQNKEKKTNESDGKVGSYFLIRSTRRQVPVFKPTSNKDRNQGRQSVTAWQEQQEVVLLPTIRFLNLLTCDICTKLFAMTPDEARGGPIGHVEDEVVIKGGEKACVYADLANLSLIIVLNGYGLTSKPVTINEREKSSSQFSLKRKGNDLKEVEAEINFGDDIHYAMLRVYRGGDGVLEVVVYTKYALHNDSHVPLLFCAPKQKSSYLWRRGRSKDTAWEWTSSPETVATLDPGSKTSWLNRSSKIAMKRVEPEAEAALLDLESLSGSAEITFKVAQGQSLDQQVQLGVKLQLPSVGDTNPTHIVHLIPRYIVINESAKAICVCQDGFQDDIRAVMVLNPGDKTAMHAQVQSDPLSTDPTTNSQQTTSVPEAGQNPALPLLLSVRFRPQESGWGWSGPVCAASLGSFCVKIRGQGQGGYSKQSAETTASQKQAKEKLWFAVAEVQEANPSLIVVFQKQVADAIPYRIENGLRSGSILYQQKGLNQPEVLESGASVSYAWDDLALPHKLVVTIAGTQMCREINMDKLRAWKLFRTATRKKGFMLQLPFQDDPGEVEEDKDILTDTEFLNVGFEVCADGPTRVLRVCKDAESNKKSQWQSNIKRRQTEMDVRVPLLCLSIVEPGKQKGESLREDAEEIEQGPPERSLSYTPIIVAHMTSLVIEGLVTVESTLCQFKVQQLDVDITWPGAPLARMLRVHGQDRFKKQGQTVLQMAAVVAHRGTNPIQIHYASLLLQTVDLNVDEDTLMRLAPFYRSSLAETTTPSRLIYYDRFEIHPIKIVASFIPGNPRADYTSAQETLRALLHSVIKIPAIRGTTVELNGVLLSNALLTYRQLAVKCAQHYSWYAMRAIYIARGSSLLPPAFASLFDDSASSSLDVFFDPSNGSIDMQGLTLGMFNILSKGLRKKGQGGTSRYLGDLEHTMRAAGSNLLFAVVTEVSDSVLKGAETSGFDGLVNGFRRGILNVAMKPAVLRSAVLQGGSTRIIKLDRNVGMDEVYIEGYLQAMLDALFKQDYLRVKVSDDQVLLKNLPPNTALMEEIIGAVKSFLIGEGLLVGESSMSGARAFRRGGNERRLGPALLALSEQLLVVIVVRGLRRQAVKVLHLPRNDQGKSQQEKMEETEKEKEKAAVNEEQQEGTGLRVRHAVTNFVISSALAYLDGRLCRHIPNTLVRRIVSGFLLSFVE